MTVSTMGSAANNQYTNAASNIIGLPTFTVADEVARKYGDSTLTYDCTNRICSAFDPLVYDENQGKNIIPSFSYLYNDLTIMPRGGSGYYCGWDDVLHGIILSKPLAKDDSNYIGKFFEQFRESLLLLR